MIKKKYYYKSPTITITLVEPLFNDLSGFIGAGTYPVGTSVTISAPSVLYDPQTLEAHNFIRWKGYAQSQTTINVSPIYNTTYTAAYKTNVNDNVRIKCGDLSSGEVRITMIRDFGEQITTVINAGTPSNFIIFDCNILNKEQDIEFKLINVVNDSYQFTLKDSNDTDIPYTVGSSANTYKFHWIFGGNSYPILNVFDS